MRPLIVIPAYNEEKRIGRMLKEYSTYFEMQRKKEGLDYELLVVINNTSDNTESVVKEYTAKNKRVSYLNLTRGGKGYAIIEGFKFALHKGPSHIGFVDADLATPPSSFHDLIREIGIFPGIIANRYLKGSKIKPKVTFRRLIVGNIFNLLVRGLFLMPYTDTQCGAKLFRADCLASIVPHLGMTQWAFDIELLYEFYKRSYFVKQIPTVWEDMEGSKVKLFRTSIQMLLACVQLRIIKSRAYPVLRVFQPLIMLAWKLAK